METISKTQCVVLADGWIGLFLLAPRTRKRIFQSSWTVCAITLRCKRTEKAQTVAPLFSVHSMDFRGHNLCPTRRSCGASQKTAQPTLLYVWQRLQGREAGQGSCGLGDACAKPARARISHGFPAPPLKHRDDAAPEVQSRQAARDRDLGRPQASCRAAGRCTMGRMQGTAVKVRAKLAKQLQRRALARPDAVRAPISSIAGIGCKAHPRYSSASAARDTFARLMPASLAAKAAARP